MTTKSFTTIAINKLSSFSTQELVNQVKNLSNDLSVGADLVSDAILEILIKRLPENEFVELCETL